MPCNTWYQQDVNFLKKISAIALLEPESGLKIQIICSIFRLKDMQNIEKKVSILVNLAM